MNSDLKCKHSTLFLTNEVLRLTYVWHTSLAISLEFTSLFSWYHFLNGRKRRMDGLLLKHEIFLKALCCGDGMSIGLKLHTLLQKSSYLYIIRLPSFLYRYFYLLYYLLGTFFWWERFLCKSPYITKTFSVFIAAKPRRHRLWHIILRNCVNILYFFIILPLTLLYFFDNKK